MIRMKSHLRDHAITHHTDVSSTRSSSFYWPVLSCSVCDVLLLVSGQDKDGTFTVTYKQLGERIQSEERPPPLGRVPGLRVQYTQQSTLMERSSCLHGGEEELLLSNTQQPHLR